MAPVTREVEFPLSREALSISYIAGHQQAMTEHPMLPESLWSQHALMGSDLALPLVGCAALTQPAVGDAVYRRLELFEQQIRTKTWRRTLPLPRRMIETDTLGAINPIVGQFAEGLVHEHQVQAIEVILEGTTVKAFDGSPLFRNAGGYGVINNTATGNTPEANDALSEANLRKLGQDLGDVNAQMSRFLNDASRRTDAKSRRRRMFGRGPNLFLCAPEYAVAMRHIMGLQRAPQLPADERTQFGAVRDLFTDARGNMRLTVDSVWAVPWLEDKRDWYAFVVGRYGAPLVTAYRQLVNRGVASTVMTPEQQLSRMVRVEYDESRWVTGDDGGQLGIVANAEFVVTAGLPWQVFKVTNG